MRSVNLHHSRSLAALVRDRAEHSPERTVYTWLADGRLGENSLTFAELHLRACGVAARLQEVVGRRERVLLLYRPGLDFITGFLGCVYASVIAVPAFAVHNTRQPRRVEGILEDSKPAAILT